MNSSLASVFVPRNQRDRSITKTMTAHKDVQNWMAKQIVESWKDPVCGDDVCEAPFEFPAYMGQGCQTDCGLEKNVVDVLVVLQVIQLSASVVADQRISCAVPWAMVILKVRVHAQRPDVMSHRLVYLSHVIHHPTSYCVWFCVECWEFMYVYSYLSHSPT